VIDRDEAVAAWKRIAEFVDEAVAAYDADPARVYLAGFSQGGIMALATLLTAPQRIAGAVMMSGRLMPEVLPHAASDDALRGKPLLVVHGARDETLGIQHARAAREALGRFPIALTYRELDAPHRVTEEMLDVVTRWLTERLDDAR
jgi:phospholipase/carboxylesterase